MVLTFSIIYSSESPKKGGEPDIRIYSNTPADQISV